MLLLSIHSEVTSLVDHIDSSRPLISTATSIGRVHLFSISRRNSTDRAENARSPPYFLSEAISQQFTKEDMYMDEHIDQNINVAPTDESPQFCLPVNGEMIEVSEEVYRGFYKEKNHEDYLAKKDKDHNIVSYNALDTETHTGEAIMPDLIANSPEDWLLANELVSQLYRCLAMLPRAERQLVEAIYFDGKSETEYAAELKMSQPGVSRRRKKILSKLRKLLEVL